MTSKKDEPTELTKHGNLFDIRNFYAPPDDSWSGNAALINKTHSNNKFHEIIKGRLVDIKIEHKTSKEVTNIFSYYGYHQNKTNENDKLELQIVLVNTKILNRKIKDIFHPIDFNYITEKIDRNNLASKCDLQIIIQH